MESPKIVVSKQPTVFDKLKEYYKLHPVVVPKDHGIKPTPRVIDINKYL